MWKLTLKGKNKENREKEQTERSSREGGQTFFIVFLHQFSIVWKSRKITISMVYLEYVYSQHTPSTIQGQKHHYLLSSKQRSKCNYGNVLYKHKIVSERQKHSCSLLLQKFDWRQKIQTQSTSLKMRWESDFSILKYTGFQTFGMQG